jgi:hypothetical protein
MRFRLMAAVALAAAISCAGQDEGLGGVRRVVYEYGDASVEPRYHRSYTIDVTKDSVHVVVDSYGDVLADTTYSLDGDRFEALLEELEESGLHSVDGSRPGGCTGGTTEAFILYGEDGVVLSGSVYHCGGEDYGDLAGDLEGAAGAVRALVPALDELTE